MNEMPIGHLAVDLTPLKDSREVRSKDWREVEPPWYVTRMPGGVGGAAP